MAEVPARTSSLKAIISDLNTKDIQSIDLNSSPASFQLSNIICTIGPASRDPEILEKMIQAGMRIARLNLSHGSHEYHTETIKNIRTASRNFEKNRGVNPAIAIAMDTRGREIRTGLLGDSAEITLVAGSKIVLTTDQRFMEEGNIERIYVNFENITKFVKPGSQILIDDGLIMLKCEAVNGKDLICRIENGGLLGSRKGVNLPGVAVDLPTISDIDIADIKFGIEEGIDFIFSSFTGSSVTVTQMREILGEKGKNIMIVSKIENQEGLTNLEEIIAVSDGIMVERGDLGSEIPIEKVFLAQKAIIASCNQAGKPVICATQMLESMMAKPRPARADIADIANAVFDGADCVMLSGETAIGTYPVECVATMSSICREAEAAVFKMPFTLELSVPVNVKITSQSVALSAVCASISISAAAIVILSSNGESAQLICKYRPRCPIIAVVQNEHSAKQANLFRAVVPAYYQEPTISDWIKDVEARLSFGINFGKKQGFIKVGDEIVVVSAWREGTACTNTMRVIQV